MFPVCVVKYRMKNLFKGTSLQAHIGSSSSHRWLLGEIKFDRRIPLSNTSSGHLIPSHNLSKKVKGYVLRFSPITTKLEKRACYTVNTFFRLLRNGILYCSLGFSSLHKCKQTIQCLLKLRRRLRLKLFRCSGPHKLVTSPYTWYPILSCSILFKPRLMC